jgi:hypothetical protein
MVNPSTICEGQSIREVVAGIDRFDAPNPWAKRVLYMRPRHFVELGTGQGASGACVMQVLPPCSRFTTINYDYPPNEAPGAMLAPYLMDPRLRFVIADTADPATVDMFARDIDLLFIDTTHRAWHAALELRLWQDKLEDGAIVIADDLGMHDMSVFWDSVPYEKVPVECGPVQGFFRYRRGVRYDFPLPRGRTSKEGQEC